MEVKGECAMSAATRLAQVVLHTGINGNGVYQFCVSNIWRQKWKVAIHFKDKGKYASSVQVKNLPSN